jgi:DNA-directed RNA polymerase specialized sigma24 family protein
VQVALKGDQARVVAAFERLSPEERVVIRLRYVNEKSVAEVARALGKTPAEIRAIEKEAMKKLRNSFPESRSPVPPPPPPPPPKPRERGAGASGGAG